MHRSMVLLMLAGFAGACGDTLVPDPGGGVLRVTITTTGADLDLDGYGPRIDRTVQPPVELNETVVVPQLGSGANNVELTGLPENCLVDGPALRSVTVAAGDTPDVAYAVICRPTGVKIIASTTGGDQDPDGYEVRIGFEDPEPLGVLGSLVREPVGDPGGGDPGIGIRNRHHRGVASALVGWISASRIAWTRDSSAPSTGAAVPTM